VRALQIFFAAILFGCFSLEADAVSDRAHALKLIDVDGNALSIADGHITVLVQTTKADLPKAQTVGERVPDYCLGNPGYRMITVVEFENQISPVRSVFTAMIRSHLDSEAKHLQARYDANKIERNARRDMFAVADFDGAAVAQLESDPAAFRVFVFGKNGQLLKQWNDVPSAAELATALK
jgi:hypothetical protein